MMSGSSRLEGGEGTTTKTAAATPMLPAPIRQTINTIKEIVGNHSDADIYSMLKETNMDPNETTQKLLYQDPFHEVRRRRDKRKENTGFRRPADPTGFQHSADPTGSRRPADPTGSRRPADPTGSRRPADPTGSRRPAEPRKETEHKVQGARSQPPTNHSSRRGGYNHNAQPGTSREFRIVRDNRVNQNSFRETKPGSVQCSTSTNAQVAPSASEKSIRVRVDHRDAGIRIKDGAKPTTAFDGPSGSGRYAQDGNLNGVQGKEVFAEIRATVHSPGSRVQNSKPYDSRPRSSASTTTNSVVGVYSSSSDPVHVPSPDSRSSSAVGAIKREVGVVGVRKQPSANTSKNPTVTPSNSSLGKDVTVSSGSIEISTALNKSDQVSQPTVAESVISSGTVSNRSFSSSGKAYQAVAGHQKAPQVNKEWKRKSSQKSSIANPGVTGKTSTFVAPPPNTSAGLTKEVVDLQEKVPEVNVFENQHVIIPQHLRVPEADRTHLTFGTFNSSNSFVASGLQSFVGAEHPNLEPSEGVLASPASTEDLNQVDLLDAPSRNSESDSPASAHESAERPLPENSMSTSPETLESYADIGLVRNSSTYTPAGPQEHQASSGLSSFQVYDPQAAYDMRFYRSAMDESAQDHGLPSQQEALTSHVANSIPASTVAMMQQPVAQMYPQVHLSHYPNFMPYRQIIPPMYVPSMVPSYSSNPAYPHPPNGSSYLLMPGTSTHMAAGGLKYGNQQFKPIPAGNHPSGFGNFANPDRYPMNAQGPIGVGYGLEDSARIKYKDGSLYIPNPQAETSEIWIQTPREIPGMQSNPYFNMQGQAPHGAYMQSHTGHASFNGATPQPAHVQFPGLYHPAAHPAPIGNPHHMVPGMGGNVGVAGAAPGGQVGPYQQSQMSHLNWAGNF